MISLSGKQRRYLRALGHHLDPVVMVGQNGVSAEVLTHLDGQLTAHELVKVKVLEGDKADVARASEALGEGTHSAVAQVMGRTVLLYRRHPKAPVIRLP